MLLPGDDVTWNLVEIAILYQPSRANLVFSPHTYLALHNQPPKTCNPDISAYE